MYASPPPPTAVSTPAIYYPQYGVPTAMERGTPHNPQWTVHGLPTNIGEMEEENTSGSRKKRRAAIIFLALFLCCTTAIVLAITLRFNNDDGKSGSLRSPDYTTEFRASIDTWNEDKAAKFRQGLVNGISGISTSNVNIQRVFSASSASSKERVLSGSTERALTPTTVALWNLKDLTSKQAVDIPVFLESTTNTAALNKAIEDSGAGTPIPSSTGLVSTHGNPTAASSPAPISGCIDQPSAVTNQANHNAENSNCTVTIASGGTCPLYCKNGFTKSADFQCSGSTWSTPTCSQTHCVIQPSNVSGGTAPQCSLPAASGTACTLTCQTGMVATANYSCNVPGWTTPACTPIPSTPTSTPSSTLIRISTPSSSSSSSRTSTSTLTRTLSQSNTKTSTRSLSETGTLSATPTQSDSSTSTAVPNNYYD